MTPSRSRARSLYLGAFVTVGFFVFQFLPSARAADVGNIAVIQTDPTILQPGELFDLNGRTLVFTPNPGGGYTTSTIDVDFDSTPGTILGLSDDDSFPQPLMFTFPFFGVSYTDVHINSNGNLTFTSSDPFNFHFNVFCGGGVRALFSTLFCPDASAVLDLFSIDLPRIAPLWQDLDPSAGGSVTVRSLADRLVVTWNNVRFFGITTRVTFQVILFATTGVIHFNYQAVNTTPGGGYLVGLSPGALLSFGPFGVTTVDFSQGNGSTISNSPDQEALAQVFGTTASPLVHINAVARKFYDSHGDDYDQLVMFGNFTHATGGAFAYEFSPKNDVSGIGVELFDSSSLFGSAGRLQSFVNMNRLGLYPASPTTNISGLGTNNTLDVLAQEAGHRWLAFVKFRDGLIDSEELLGRGLAHWSFFHHTDASDMEGNNWQDNFNGTFTTTEATSRYSPLDQYAMGFRMPADVSDFFFINNPSFVNCTVLDPDTGDRSCAPRVGVTVSGTRQNVSVDDVIASEGARSPSSGFSAVNPTTNWKQAFILLVRTATAPLTALNKIETIRSAWVPYFGNATSGLGFADTILPGGESTLQFSSATYSADENGGSVTITVTRTDTTTGDLTVDYATSNGTATAGADYTATSGTLTFGAGVTSQTFTIPITDDLLPEGNETVNLTISNPTGHAVLGSLSTAVLTIVDDEIAIHFNSATYTVGEGTAIRRARARITVTRSGPTTATVGVDYATSDGSALAGLDYTATLGTLIFSPGIVRRTFTVPIRHDTVDESDETVNLTLSNPTGGAQLGTQSTAVLTIADNDAAGTLFFSSPTYSVGEGTATTPATAVITVRRTGGAASGITIDYSNSGITATAGMDYTETSGTLTFGARQTSRTFRIPILHDTLDEPNETVQLTLSMPGGGATVALGSPSTAVLTIVNNDFTNVRGLYTLSTPPSSVTLSSCTTPANDGIFDLSGTINISSQTARNFSGPAILFYTNPSFGMFRLNATFNGTVNPDGTVNGTFTFNTTLPPSTTILTRGSGMFTGSLFGDTLTATITGQVTTNETCQLSGILTGTRPPL